MIVHHVYTYIIYVQCFVLEATNDVHIHNYVDS